MKVNQEIEIRFMTVRSAEPAYIYKGSTETEEYKKIKALKLPALQVSEEPLIYTLWMENTSDSAKVFQILKVFPKTLFLKTRLLEELRKKNILP